MSPPSGRRRLRWRPTPDTAIAFTALVLAVGGGGYALGAASGDQVITACVDSASGQPTKIITSGSCDPAQTALSWNQAGPQGPVGSTGVQGPVGPAGKDSPSSTDQTVIALPPKPSLRSKGRFTVKLELPAPGTYAIDGHVQWTRSALPADAPIGCKITRDRPATVLDTQKSTVLMADIFNVGAIDESAVTTVAAPASSGPDVAPFAPVTVTFSCLASRSAASPAANSRIVFRDWTLSATPVKVYTVQKPK